MIFRVFRIRAEHPISEFNSILRGNNWNGNFFVDLNVMFLGGRLLGELYPLRAFADG